MNYRKLLSLLIAVALVSVACKPSPESLEKWRNAEGGTEKLASYAKDSSMPDPVRLKAFEIISEDAVNTSDLTGVLKDVSPKTASEFANDVAPIIKKKWEAHDFPTEEDVKKHGGKLNVAGSKAVLAKDLAFFLVPYATGDAKKEYEGILADWLSTDYELRNQLGATTLGQIAPLTGEAGSQNLKKWLSTSTHPAQVARLLRDNATPEVEAQVAQILNDRANAEYPNISESLDIAILETKHRNIIPFLQKVLEDPDADTKLYDDALDIYIKIVDKEAIPLLTKLVTEKSGNIRWVAAQRIVELAGVPGLHIVAEALPEAYKAYEGSFDWTIDHETQVFCNFLISEAKKRKDETLEKSITTELGSKRWPNQLIAMQCIRGGKFPDASVDKWKSRISSLRSSRAIVPRWNTKGEQSSIGNVAKDTLTDLNAPKTDEKSGK